MPQARVVVALGLAEDMLRQAPAESVSAAGAVVPVLRFLAEELAAVVVLLAAGIFTSTNDVPRTTPAEALSAADVTVPVLRLLGEELVAAVVVVLFRWCSARAI